MDERQRLVKLMESEGLNAKQFSEQVGISAGTLSNIIGGRNKPSLEVLQAVLNRFRTVSSDWLILDVGPMYRMNGDGPQTALFDIKPDESAQSTSTQENKVNVEKELPVKTAAKVDKIIIFYTDGTFEQR